MRLRSRSGSKSHSGFHSMFSCRFATPTVRGGIQNLYRNPVGYHKLFHVILCKFFIFARTAEDVGPYDETVNASVKRESIKPLPSLCRFGVIMTPSPYSDDLQIFYLSRDRRSCCDFGHTRNLKAIQAFIQCSRAASLPRRSVTK